MECGVQVARGVELRRGSEQLFGSFCRSIACRERGGSLTARNESSLRRSLQLVRGCQLTLGLPLTEGVAEKALPLCELPPCTRCFDEIRAHQGARSGQFEQSESAVLVRS